LRNQEKSLLESKDYVNRRAMNSQILTARHNLLRKRKNLLLQKKQGRTALHLEVQAEAKVILLEAVHLDLPVIRTLAVEVPLTVMVKIKLQ